MLKRAICDQWTVVQFQHRETLRSTAARGQMAYTIVRYQLAMREGLKNRREDMNIILHCKLDVATHEFLETRTTDGQMGQC